MIKVNFKDGSTIDFDLQKDEDNAQWLEWSSVKDFQKKITGIGILHQKKFLTLPFPKRFRKVRFYADLVYTHKKGVKRLLGERIVCHADEVKYSLLMYTYDKPPPPVLCRVDVEKIGKQMFSGVNEKGVKQ